MGGTCGDCKHWHPEVGVFDNHGECALADHRYVWGLKKAEPDRTRPRFEKTGEGDLLTASDFGCVEFEAKA